ncbi:sterol desaturase family protein [Leptolyngbya sp. PCC 6406]|uniref:sterol desaturase family protein n=1 Tax=Leptolyngbya sp. PCC 6406 TaxID=1173264 RepID=UPI0002AC60FC|nr:sterol desaturase family protein [Leptolyngbya sp. PCC 6406]
MDVIKALAAAGLLLLLGDFVATFCYHVPEHVFGKFHNIVHHSPRRSFVRYALRTRQPLALLDGFCSALPYFAFVPLLWLLSPWGIALGLLLAEGHVIWRHRFPPQYCTPDWLKILCRWIGITTPERHWIHHRYGYRAFGDIFSFYGKPAEMWLIWLRWVKRKGLASGTEASPAP